MVQLYFYDCLYYLPNIIYHTDNVNACVLPSFNSYLVIMLSFTYILLQVLLYAAVAMILIFPFDIFYLSSRFYLLRTLWRIVLPLQASLFLSGQIFAPFPVCCFCFLLTGKILLTMLVYLLEFELENCEGEKKKVC